MDSEYESRLKERDWKAVRGGEHSGVSVRPEVSPLEQIEKWKALVDTKDEIMKQKSCLIDR